MTNNYEAETLACAILLSDDGLPSELFIACLPSASARKAIPRMLLKGLIDGRDGTIKKGVNLAEYTKNIALDPDDAIVFLARLLDALEASKACSDIEKNPDYMKVTHIFYRACIKYAGTCEDTDAMLSFLFAKLLCLLDSPLFHCVGPNTVEEEGKEVASVLLEAEVTLAYRLLQRAFTASDVPQLTMLKFVQHSWALIIELEQQLDPQSTRLHDFEQMLVATARAVKKTERILALERKLQHLEKLRNGEVT